LGGEEKALANGLVAADAEEIAMLRNVINRQLMIQERRRQQTRILLEGAKQLGNKDPKIREAVELLEGDDLKLTEEEQKAVAGRADAEFYGPNALDPDRVAFNRTALAKDIASYDRAATKAFVGDKLLPARELFQLILEENPGHVMSLCKLGVVQLKLSEPSSAADAFRRAVELEPNNPYAHRMLGFALLTQGDTAGAEPCVRRSVELAQDDPKSRNLLGTICYRLGQTKDAETHFKAAISADAMFSDPYFNLALLLSRDKDRLTKAREYYQQALERGAVPDPKLEQTFAAP
jgi:tetratricopeptide (TPR) repeat protein